MSLRTVGIIGMGSLGKHLTKMLLTQRQLEPLMKYPCYQYAPPLSVIGSVRNKDRAAVLEYNFGSALRTYPDNCVVANKSDVVILAVKPGQVKEVCEEISSSLKDNTVVISTAAAVPLNKLQSWIPNVRNVIRCMPNTPCSIGSGVVTYYCKHNNGAAIMKDLFKPNEVIPLYSDEEMDASTLISGCGPAFIAWYTNLLANISADTLHPSTVNNLLAHTMIGTAELLKTQNSRSIIKSVASPRGATEAALDHLDTMRTGERISTALNAANDRIRKLAEDL